MEMEHWYDGDNGLDSHYLDEREETDNEYNIIEALIESRLNCKQLEIQIDKIRNNIIKTCKTATPNNLYQLKINYTEIGDKLEKEWTIFNELLQDLNEDDFININTNNISEIIENTSVHSDINTSQSQLYNDDTISLTQEIPEISQIKPIKQIENNDWNLSVESTPEPEPPQEPEPEPEPEPVPVAEPVIIPIKHNNKSSSARKRRLRRKKANINNSFDSIRPKTKDSNIKLKSKVNPKQSKNKINKNNNIKINKSKRKLDVNNNNNNKIYSSTLLFCKETFNLDEKLLREYLLDCGKWTNDMIEEIMFKEGNYNNYALIRVRADIKCIHNGIENINGYYYKDAIQIFKRYTNENQNISINKCNVLYVNNFDILGKNTIKKLTNLFAKYGELERDIKMGIDRVNDPYAIVYFKKIKDAKKCFEKELAFGAKILSIKYSKFG